MRSLLRFLATVAWLIGLPLALLIVVTFPAWFLALWIYCACMAGEG